VGEGKHKNSVQWKVSQRAKEGKKEKKENPLKHGKIPAPLWEEGDGVRLLELLWAYAHCDHDTRLGFNPNTLKVKVANYGVPLNVQLEPLAAADSPCPVWRDLGRARG